MIHDQTDSEQNTWIHWRGVHWTILYLNNLAGIFPNRITPTLHPSSSSRHRTIQPQVRQQTPSVTSLPLHPEISQKIDNLHNSFKYKKKSILSKQHKLLPKGKFSSNLPFRKSRYSPNNLPDFSSGYKLTLNIDTWPIVSGCHKLCQSIQQDLENHSSQFLVLLVLRCWIRQPKKSPWGTKG